MFRVEPAATIWFFVADLGRYIRGVIFVHLNFSLSWSFDLQSVEGVCGLCVLNSLPPSPYKPTTHSHRVCSAFNVQTCIIQYTYVNVEIKPMQTIYSVPGAFLVPFLICWAFAAVPIFFLEVSIGQYLQLGGLSVWKLCPILKGTYVLETRLRLVFRLRLMSSAYRFFPERRSLCKSFC